MSGLSLLHCSKLAINLKNGNYATNSDITRVSDFFDTAVFFFSSLVTGPSFTSISLLVLELWQFSSIKGWPEIWKSEIPPSEFCSISGAWSLGQVRNTRLVTNVSNEMLLNAAKCKFYSFYRFWVIKGKLVGVGKITSCAFHFVEIQAAFYPYLQSGLDVFK